MLSANSKRRLRHVVLVGTCISFPLLYMGPVTLESATVTLAGLVLGVATAVLAWLVF